MSALTGPSEALPERVLLEHVAAGSLEALGELRRRHGASVYDRAYRVVFDPRDASSVVDVVFAEVSRQAEFLNRLAVPSLERWLCDLAEARGHAMLVTRGLGRWDEGAA